MKYFILIYLLSFSFSIFAEDLNCVDLSKREWIIIQKLDDHHYEMIDPSAPDSIHLILRTKHATFYKGGLPVGIKAKRGGSEEVELKNGFSKSVGLYTECKLLPLEGRPENNNFLSVRTRLKSDPPLPPMKHFINRPQARIGSDWRYPSSEGR